MFNGRFDGFNNDKENNGTTFESIVKKALKEALTDEKHLKASVKLEIAPEKGLSCEINGSGAAISFLLGLAVSKMTSDESEEEVLLKAIKSASRNIRKNGVQL